MSHRGVFSLRYLVPRFPDPPEPPAGTRWVIVREDGICIVPGAFPSVYSRSARGISPDRCLYIGHRGDVPYYAAGTESSEPVPEGLEYTGVRELFGRVPDEELAIAAYAVRIIRFNAGTRYCGRCGSMTRPVTGERARCCDRCGQVFYPRLSPAVVVLVQREDQILLARSPRFPPGMFSLVAGFVEPGENLEHAVAREVQEETGIKVRNIRYFGSEPWPFPDSLMSGFTADFAGGELVIDKKEIESAFWFDREHLPRIPEKLSISRALIDQWLEQQGD